MGLPGLQLCLHAGLAGLALSCAAAAPQPERNTDAPRDAPAPEPPEKEAVPVAPANVAPPEASKPAGPPERRPPSDFRMAVPGYEDAIVSFPPSAPLPAPVMVVTHGAGNTPESMCEVFRLVVGDRLVLLCPAGPRIRAGDEGRYYPDHFALEKIVFASLAALREAFPRHVDAAGAIYSGYSQGATMGALMIPAHGAEFPLLALVEGGVEGWTVARSKKFRDSGGRRALFACGTPHCQKHAEKVADTLRKSGVEAKVVAATTEGHTYGGKVAYVLAESFDWLVQEDPR